MPQQFTTGDGQESGVSAGQASVPSAQARYDRATVERAIRLASEMQAAHRDTMTREQAEAIGEEVGVDPAFVRQALAQLEAGEASPVLARPAALTARRRVSKNALHGRRPTRRRFITGAGLTAAGYGLLSFAINAYATPQTLGSVIIPLLFVFPFVVAALVGAGGGGKRRGAAGGFAVALCAVFGAIAASCLQHPFSLQAQDIYIISAIITGGAVAGGIGAVIRQALDAYLSGDAVNPPPTAGEAA